MMDVSAGVVSVPPSPRERRGAEAAALRSSTVARTVRPPRPGADQMGWRCRHGHEPRSEP
jgi:hypothetical protein